MSVHSEMTGQAGGLHVLPQWTFASKTARAVATDPYTGLAYQSDDIGKIARQSDNDTLWMLTAIAPTWKMITPRRGSGVLATSGYLSITVESEVTVVVATSGDAAIAGRLYVTSLGSGVWRITSTSGATDNDFIVYWIAF